MYPPLNEVMVKVKVVHPNLVYNAKVCGQEDGIHFILLAKAQCVYMQDDADHVHGLSFYKLSDYNFKEVLLRKTK